MALVSKRMNWSLVPHCYSMSRVEDCRSCLRGALQLHKPRANKEQRRNMDKDYKCKEVKKSGRAEHAVLRLQENSPPADTALQLSSYVQSRNTRPMDVPLPSGSSVALSAANTCHGFNSDGKEQETLSDSLENPEVDRESGDSGVSIMSSAVMETSTESPDRRDESTGQKLKTNSSSCACPCPDVLESELANFIMQMSAEGDQTHCYEQVESKEKVSNISSVGLDDEFCGTFTNADGHMSAKALLSRINSCLGLGHEGCQVGVHASGDMSDESAALPSQSKEEASTASSLGLDDESCHTSVHAISDMPDEANVEIGGADIVEGAQINEAQCHEHSQSDDTVDSERHLGTAESRLHIRRPSTQSNLSEAIRSVDQGDEPCEADVYRVSMIFHRSIPRDFAEIECITRVTNASLYSKFRNVAAAEGGCEVVFYAPPDLRCLGRLRENGLSEEDFQGDEHCNGIRVSLFPGTACAEALSVQKQKSGHPYCICLLLCCLEYIAKDSGRLVEELPNTQNYTVLEPSRLYLAYVIDFWVPSIHNSELLHNKTHDAEYNAEERHDAEYDAEERHRFARARWQQYQIEAEMLFADSLSRLQSRSALIECADRREACFSPRLRPQLQSQCRLIPLEGGSQEAGAVISLYLLGGGVAGQFPSGPSKIKVHRVENNALYVDYCAQGMAQVTDEGEEYPSSPRGWCIAQPSRTRARSRSVSRERVTTTAARPISPSPRRARRSRFREQIVWHGTRLKKEDGANASLEQKLQSIAINGFDPYRCVKGATARGGIWAATAPLASFGKGYDGRVAFFLCTAKTLFNEWVGTSSVRILDRARILPLYIIMHE